MLLSLVTLFWVNPIREPISVWGQWDSNPRPPAPQAYTPIEMVSLTKLDDSPSIRNFIIPLLNVHNSDQYLNRNNSHLELQLFILNIDCIRVRICGSCWQINLEHQELFSQLSHSIPNVENLKDRKF